MIIYILKLRTKYLSNIQISEYVNQTLIQLQKFERVQKVKGSKRFTVYVE